jgi:outer membrane protein TolC
MKLLIIPIVSFRLGACAVGANYQRPLVSTPPAWTQATGTAAGVDAATEKWWKTFHNAELDALVDRAVQGQL